MPFTTSDGVPISGGVSVPAYYGTVTEGNIYFDNQLNKELWSESSNTDKIKALIMATQAIDALNYVGSKHVATQELEFPRGEDTVVPTAINRATYECAYLFLDGIDIDKEIENLNVVGQGFSGARTTYDRNYILEHLRAGIPSAKAWSWLKPYLRSSKNIDISRISQEQPNALQFP